MNEIDVPVFRYTAQLATELELRWQDEWARKQVFAAPNPVGSLAAPAGTPAAERAERPKLMVMDMFPYPSGAGLHVGHPLGYIGTDVYARFKRMTGYNVMHPFGYDAFGLPAEQYAVQTGQHPRVTTENNIVTMRAQLRRLGLGHDPTRTFATIDPDYYRWTQWIFLEIYNSWYDEVADKARPIAELIAQFESGERQLSDGRTWADLSPAARADLLDDYRLAYSSEAPVNWAPGLGTVLANEEVTADGRSERGNFPVFKRSLRQWMMRITSYADRLVADLDEVDWPEAVKTMQRNWIGRSDGARVDFAADGHTITVFTTRPDTIFGCSYLVLAPEHELVDKLGAAVWPAQTNPLWTGDAAGPRDAIAVYRRQIAAESDAERTSTDLPKTGVFIGAYAVNPANGQQVPIFISDYVLAGYGTGAVMGVPGEDQRDWDFTDVFELPRIRTVQPPVDFDGEAYSGDGVMINSASERIALNGLPWQDAKQQMIDWLAKSGHGEWAVTYKLRDWLFSRQRYWGEPFPIVYDADGVAHALPDSMLPVKLPELDDYSPRTFDANDADSEPQPPLARATDWVTVTLDLGDGPREYRRETNTMPNWAGSCWYELRYLDPKNESVLVDPEVEKYWMGPRGERHPGGVDLYIGGVEHAVLHLLYARFWHKVLHDLGHVSSREPFYRLYNQGYIQAYAYTDERGSYVPASEVQERDGGFVWHGKPVNREYGKMGKSLKNVVTPDEVCEEYGADTFRLYEMSMGPLDASRPWETRAVVGSYRFLQRVWRALIDETTGELRISNDAADDETRRVLHATIAAVRTEVDGLRFNTAIARLIELTNHVTQRYGQSATPREVAEPLVLLLAPFAPHIAEELWHRLGHTETVTYEPFPVADPQWLRADTVEYPVQVNGKVRARITVAADTSSAEVEKAALAESNVQAHLGGKPPRKVLVVPGRIVTVVAG